MNSEQATQPLLLEGDYEYLSEGYYACLEAEVSGEQPLPTCADTLDAYVVPLALERARLAGLPVPVWYLTNDFFQCPAVLYGVNPFARCWLLVEDPEQRMTAMRKMTRRGKFVVCCQELPPGSRLVEFEMVLGRSPQASFDGWAERLFGVFQLPLARIRLIETPDGYLFSALERLPRKQLSEAAAALLQPFEAAEGRYE